MKSDQPWRASDDLFCQFRPSEQGGAGRLNSSYSTRAQVLPGAQEVTCPVPYLQDAALDHLWLVVRKGHSDERQPLALSVPLRVWLKPAPKVLYFEPTSLPAGAPTGSHRIRIVRASGLDADQHAISVGADSPLCLLSVDSDGVVSFKAPERPKGFHRLTVHLRQGWEQAARVGDRVLSWPTLASIEYVELPQLHSLLPASIRGGPPPGTNPKVVVVGRNFTRETRCLIGGASVPTRWLASNLLECEVVSPGVAGTPQPVTLLERGLHLSRGPGLLLHFTKQSFVFRLDPQKVLVQRIPAVITAYVADPEESEPLRPGAPHYCKFGTRVTSAVSVAPIRSITAAELLLVGTASPTRVLEVKCRSPTERTAMQLQVEIVTPHATTHSVGHPGSNLQLLARPRISSISPPVAPLMPAGSEVKLVATGTDIDIAFAYTCSFFRPASIQQTWVIQALRTSATTVECTLPADNAADLLPKLQDRGPFMLNVTLRAELPEVAAGSQRASPSTSLIG